MIQITIAVNGMMCGMCETHINDTIRQAFQIKKITSSHTKGKTVIITENDIPDDLLRKSIEDTGYTVKSIEREQYNKKGLFSFFKK